MTARRRLAPKTAKPAVRVQAPVTAPLGDPASSTLVTTVRRLTGAGTTEYTIGTDTYWTDDQIQAVIDGRVCGRLIQSEVELIPSVNSSGQLVFLNGCVRFPGTLDTANASIVDYGGGAITGTTIHDDGRIEFDSDQATNVPLLSGLAYDLYGAAADLLTSWAGAVKSGVDIMEDGQSFKRSQQHGQLLAQANALRARAVIGTVPMVRTDVRRHHGSSQRTHAALQAFRRWGQR